MQSVRLDFGIFFPFSPNMKPVVFTCLYAFLTCMYWKIYCKYETFCWFFERLLPTLWSRTQNLITMFLALRLILCLIGKMSINLTIFSIINVGFPGQQRAKVSEVSKFGRPVSGCYL